MDGEKELQRKCSDDEPFSALAFKIMTDPFVGTLAFARVYSGVLQSGSTVENTVKEKKKELEECFRCMLTAEKILKKLVQEI